VVLFSLHNTASSQQYAPKREVFASASQSLERPPSGRICATIIRKRVTMASSSHPAFPPTSSRPYGSSLGKLPDRTSMTPQGTGVGGAFGSSMSHQHREVQRHERERQDRLQRGGENEFAELSEEQREEINEAVSTGTFTPHRLLGTLCAFRENPSC
jgi:hypothetical protein